MQQKTIPVEKYQTNYFAQPAEVPCIEPVPIFKLMPRLSPADNYTIDIRHILHTFVLSIKVFSQHYILLHLNSAKLFLA